MQLRKRLLKIHKQQKRETQKHGQPQPPPVPQQKVRRYPIDDTELAVSEAGPDPDFGESFYIPVSGFGPEDFPGLLMVHRFIMTMHKPLELPLLTFEVLCLEVAGRRKGGALDRICVKLVKVLLDATEVIVCGTDLTTLTVDADVFPAMFHIYLTKMKETGRDVVDVKEALERTTEHATFHSCDAHVKVLVLLCNLVLECHVIRDYIDEELEEAHAIKVKRYNDKIARNKRQLVLEDVTVVRLDASTVIPHYVIPKYHSPHGTYGQKIFL